MITKYKQVVNAVAYVMRTQETQCINMPNLSKGTYGKVWIKGVPKSAHRLAYELYNNVTVHDEIMVRHSCDNRKCCNPLHLSLGTNQDNMDDKRRQSLSDKDVREIYRLATNRVHTQKVIGEMFDIGKSFVNHIKSGLHLSHITGHNAR